MGKIMSCPFQSRTADAHRNIHISVDSQKPANLWIEKIITPLFLRPFVFIQPDFYNLSSPKNSELHPETSSRCTNPRDVLSGSAMPPAKNRLPLTTTETNGWLAARRPAILFAGPSKI